MSERYTVPGPACRHRPAGRVEAGDRESSGPYASTYVCARPACISDAREWATAITHQPASELLPVPESPA